MLCFVFPTPLIIGASILLLLYSFMVDPYIQFIKVELRKIRASFLVLIIKIINNLFYS